LLILLIVYNHYILILNLSTTIKISKFKYYNQWVAYLKIEPNIYFKIKLNLDRYSIYLVRVMNNGLVFIYFISLLFLFSVFFYFILVFTFTFLYFELEQKVWCNIICGSHTQITKHDKCVTPVWEWLHMSQSQSHMIIWYRKEYRRFWNR